MAHDILPAMDKIKVSANILFVAATEMELPKLISPGSGVCLLATGPGPVNAACALASWLALNDAGLVVNIGIGGAFAEAGLKAGDLAVATTEHDVDTGVEPKEAGNPPLPIGAGTFSFGPYPTDAEISRTLFECAANVANAAAGPFVTSATVTATALRAKNLRAAYGALCESMEGAACARVAALYGVRFAELRAISNSVGPRDRGAWKVDEALAALNLALSEFLKRHKEKSP